MIKSQIETHNEIDAVLAAGVPHATQGEIQPEQMELFPEGTPTITIQ